MLYFVVVLTLIVSREVTSRSCSSGTTPHLEEIVLGRCWSYLQTENLEGVSCSVLWGAFYKGFAFKDPCTVEMSDYELFFDAGSKQEIKKSLFWSGTKDTAHSYSNFGNRATRLEDTLEGSMMNDLCWCGSTTTGINYTSCPGECGAGSRLKSITSFWDLASKKFAERVRGVVQVLLNGSRETPAFNPLSVFARMEFPNIKAPLINCLKILVAHTPGKQRREWCNHGSIKDLQDAARNRGMEAHCINDQDDVRHILCSFHAEEEDCKFQFRYHQLTINTNRRT